MLAAVVDAVPDADADQCIIGVCEGDIHAGKEADVSELRRAVPLQVGFFFFFLFFVGYRGIVHRSSDDVGTERTWFEPGQRPRKRVPKRSVHGKQSPQGASRTFWRQDGGGLHGSHPPELHGLQGLSH